MVHDELVVRPFHDAPFHPHRFFFLGVVGLGVGVLSVYWALFEDPAAGGDLAARGEYLRRLVTEDRVSLAFVVDIALFSVWQAWFIGEVDEEAPAACRFVPYWGLAAWLML